MSRPILAAGGLVLIGLLGATTPTAGQPPTQATADSELYLAVNDEVRNGGAYYPAHADGLTAFGYLKGSLFNWRLPTLTVFQSAMPAAWSPRILTVLGAIGAGLWGWHLRKSSVAAAIVAAAGQLAMLPAWMHVGVSTLHDLWAGQLIVLSLACRANRFLPGAILFAAIALSIRELALGFVLVMAVMALVDGLRKEAFAWLCLVLGLVIFLSAHAWMIAPFRAGDAGPATWLAFGGWPFVLRTSRAYLPLFFTPVWLNAVLVPILWLGLVRWKSPAGRRVAAVVTCYMLFFLAAGLPVSWYWGFLIAPLLPLGASALLVGRTGTRQVAAGNLH